MSDRWGDPDWGAAGPIEYDDDADRRYARMCEKVDRAIDRRKEEEMTERKERCATCRHYDYGESLCRCHPPAVKWSPDERRFLAVHPPRKSDDWCGDWKPIQSEADLTEGGGA